MLPNLPGDIQNKVKSFWERPEGTTGIFFLVGGLSVLGYVLYNALPFIIKLMENTLHAIALGCVLFVVIFILLDKRFQTLVASFYKSLMRFITGLFIMIDPIGIIKNYLETLEKNLSDMKQQLGRLKGEMKKLQIKVQENEKTVQSQLKTASAAKEKGNTGVMVLQTRKAGRLQDSNMTLQALLNRMDALYRVLFKMCEVSEILVEDVRDQIQVKEAEYQAMKAGYSAFKSALKIISGGTDEKALFDQTMQYLADDLGAKLGEIETFMEMSQGFLNSIDIQQGVFTEEGMSMLEKWEKQSESLMLGDEKQQLLAMAGTAPVDFETVGVSKPASSGKYLDSAL